jgi:hypothetical protein
MKYIAIVCYLLVLGSASLNAQINIIRADVSYSSGEPVTQLEFLLENGQKKDLSYSGQLALLSPTNGQEKRDLILCNSKKTILGFNIRYALQLFDSYVILQHNGNISVVPSIGQKAYDVFLSHNNGKKGASTVIEKISGNRIYFIHIH